MAIAINWTRQIMGGKWQVNVTGNDGETRLLKFPTDPTNQQVRAVVREIEDREDAERAAQAAERARLQALRSRVKDFKDGLLTNAQAKDLLNDLFDDLKAELKE
jgi:polyhydroxyalkanoate synthesis regulator phasin